MEIKSVVILFRLFVSPIISPCACWQSYLIPRDLNQLTDWGATKNQFINTLPESLAVLASGTGNWNWAGQGKCQNATSAAMWCCCCRSPVAKLLEIIIEFFLSCRCQHAVCHKC